MGKRTIFLGVAFLCAAIVLGQASRQRPQTPQASQGPDYTFEEYNPPSTLKVPRHPVLRAKYPFIDVHSHQRYTPERLEKLLPEMDKMNLRVMVNLSGGTGDSLLSQVKAFKDKYPDRFAIFANVDFRDINEPGFGERAAQRLAQDVKNGAVGLKIFKNYGMDLKYADGRRVPVDDPVMDPVWEMCGRLNIPVLIHVAEPEPFFEPLDKNNERLEELKTHPGRARPPDRYPSWQTLMDERARMFAKHPKTRFIAAHMGWYGNDLETLGKLFDQLPNMYVDVAAILAELGRQPLYAHDFFVKYQDRILFGKDIYEPEEYTYYFHVFETRDEYFDYYRHYHAFWKLYGMGLPDDVLKKLYYKNALRVVPGLPSKGFPN